QLSHQLSRSSGGSLVPTLPRSSSLLALQAPSDNSPDSALAAILALTQSHQRSKSVHLAGARSRGASSVADAHGQGQSHGPGPNHQAGGDSAAGAAPTPSAADEAGLNPFA